MTAARLVELGCDNDICWSGPYCSTTDDYDEARRQAAQYRGWSYNSDTDEDFCSKCTKLREGN